ncbi:hypothetical protein [Bosea sp. (in: a-proteobacteria)]|uniref:hypothetical protein n=1 Tax=Bosea sp. (in: a-proteobacteria) TaxID=1871050 RepID=UPI001AC4D0D5|nr:hypothetical protein [Bosea sp. (in: a-proteobacteria)]MBN9444741.1 hypothetical protein [Bosea sp. (in: a-proteobacteria)]
MRRTAALACLVATLVMLPLQAEARRFRLGAHGSAPAAKTGRSMVIVPGVAAASRPQGAGAAEEPRHVPFPPSSAGPVPLRLSTNDDGKQPWCGTQVVVGGFCMMN